VAEVSEEQSGEEVKREVEELPEEARELGEEKPGEAREEKPEEAPPPQPAGYESIVEEFRKRKELAREVVEFAKEVSSLTPEQAAVATQILDRILPRTQAKPQVITVEKPVPVEKPVVKTVEKPVPVVPESVEEKLTEIDRKLSAYDKVLEKISALSESTVSLATELARVREELARVKEENRKVVEGLREQVMVVPKTRIRRQDGTEVEEYDWHPRLKYLEKQADFAFSQLGPAILQEIRLTRTDISSGINRLIAIFESALLPELRKRAPRIAEDLEERLRRLVGTLTPEERERELAELEKKVEELTKGAEKK
jgi:hypothetical protein